MMRQRSHIASAMAIGVDGSLEYYYVMLLLVLLAEHDKGAADFRQGHQRATW